jgi:hypothetical protein
MTYSTGRTRVAYSFIKATIPLDPKTAQRLFASAWQQLCKSDANFNDLFNQLEKTKESQVMGVGREPSIDNFAQPFMSWLETKGIFLSNVRSLMNTRLFFYKDEARNIRDGRPYSWMVGVYFVTD